jgi:SAM-dependent MidA family methyltransferase
MQTGNPTLIELIRSEITNRGLQTFAWFMQQALYHAEHGYYASGRCAIGRKGDYFTNVSVGPFFGRLLAAQFAEIWERLGKANDFVVIEQGAHDGQFARDVLQAAQERAPEFFQALRYRIVEPFPILREQQSHTLKAFRDKVEWHDSLKPFVGVHFSNELLDAMPVRLISDGTEKLVDVRGDKFVFVERPLPQGMTASQPTRNEAAFNQAALDWVDDVSANLRRGYVIAIDYGQIGDEFCGNVQVRAQHRRLDSPFEQIGHADITMPVDWTSIARCAEASGLRVAGFTDQHHFLTGIISAWPNLLQGAEAAADAKIKRELQTLLHPEMLGRAFQVLALAKEVEQAKPLAGFKFARYRGGLARNQAGDLARGATPG